MSSTYKPKKLVRARRHGFMSRNGTRSGRALMKRRRQKGRYKLTVSDE